jgi:hypothetical protein
MDSTKSYTLDQKLKFYSLARDLFNEGYSYPQVIERLVEIECDIETAKTIAEKALPERWDELFHIAKKSIAQGKTYSEVIDLLEKHEDDKEIVKFLVDAWYEVKTFEVENIVESPTNIFEGLKWVVISGVAIPIVFLLNLSVISKSIWVIVFIGAIIQYLLGLKQRRLAKQTKKFLEDE